MKIIIGSILGIAGSHPRVFEASTTLIMVFFMVALAMLAMGVYFSNRRKAWLQHSATVEGMVVYVNKRYDRQDTAGRHPIYFPVVTFQVNGRQFKIEALKGWEKATNVGESLEVRYNPENPDESSLGGFNIPGVKPQVFFVLGALLAIVSTLLIVK